MDLGGKEREKGGGTGRLSMILLFCIGSVWGREGRRARIDLGESNIIHFPLPNRPVPSSGVPRHSPASWPGSSPPPSTLPT